jgi:hypothetical protein
MTTIELGARAAQEPSADLLPLSDEELTAQALAADPDAPLGDDAVPFGAGPDAVDAGLGGLLPSWYMPGPVTASRKRWHRVLVIAAIIGFVVINASGFCITYGILEGA